MSASGAPDSVDAWRLKVQASALAGGFMFRVWRAIRVWGLSIVSSAVPFLV